MNISVDQVKSKKNASRSAQTLFRVTYRTQINLIRIADNKANMIMGINAMIITVLMAIFSSQMVFTSDGINGETVLMIPVVFIMLTALFTAFFAIRAAKPRLITSKPPSMDENKNGSYLFFENIWSMSTEDYINKMEDLLNSSQDIYQNMIIDIHNQAKVLHRKYRLLAIAYLIFLIGYITSIVAFLVLWLFY